MARPIWKGSISFGLVNVPVTLFSGENRNDISFRMLDGRNKARVRYERVNEVTGEPVPWEDIVKAYEYEDGEYVVVSEEDFKHAAPEASQTVEIEDFVKQDEIDIPYYDKPYVLVPGKKGEKGYVLLRETLRDAGVVGIAEVVIRTRQYLSALVVQGDALCLEILRYEQELRKPDEFELPTKKPSEYKISKKELEMAKGLVDSMTTDWEPARYKDDYRDKLLAWIEKKAEAGGEITPPEPVEEKRPSGEIIDFMELLQKSMKRQKQSRSGGKEKRAARTTAAKKVTAKKKAPSSRKKRTKAS
jgi:DNA end-binding protein Ku